MLKVPRDPRKAVADALEGVGVSNVPAVAVDYQQVLEAVEIDVEEGRSPRPVGGRHAREIGHLGPGAVSSRQLQRIPHPLTPVGRQPYALGQRGMGRDLALACLERRAEHVGREQVRVPIAVHVCEVDRHAGIARFAHRKGRNKPEVSLAVVEPELVGIFEVVADVEVGRAVAVHVVEARRQREEVGLGGEGGAILAQESRAGNRHAGEATMAVIEKKQIDIGALGANDASQIGTFVDAILGLPGIHDHVSPIDLLHYLVEGARLRRKGVERIALFIGRDIEVERAVAIDVGQGEGGGRVASGESARRCSVGEVTLSVVGPEHEGTA